MPSFTEAHFGSGRSQSAHLRFGIRAPARSILLWYLAEARLAAEGGLGGAPLRWTSMETGRVAWLRMLAMSAGDLPTT